MTDIYSRAECNKCICKTCAIAEVNGGAEGCGNCYECITNGEMHCFRTRCSDYYNADTPGDAQYWVSKIVKTYNEI